VNELDPTRPYAAGSPWSAWTGAHPNDPRHASVHIWDVWNGQDDYPKYREYRPHFVAEFGFQDHRRGRRSCGQSTTTP